MSSSSTSSHWETAIGVGAAGCFLSVASVCARLYTRYFVTRSLGIDDLMAIISLFATIGMCVTLGIYAARYTSGAIGVWTLAEVEQFLLIFWINELLYNIGNLFIKWTYLFQYLQVFRKVKIMRLAYIVCIVLVGAWYGYQIFGLIFSCKPVSGFWDKTIESNCNVSMAESSYSLVYIYINAGGTLLIDIIVLLLPIPAIWNLELHHRQKWAIFGIFAVGGIVPIITAGRISSLNSTSSTALVDSGIWSLVELCAGIITAALATIRLLVSPRLPVFNAKSAISDLGSVRHQSFKRFGSRRMASSGSQRDLVHRDDCEMHETSTGHSSIDIRKEDRSSTAQIIWKISSEEAVKSDKIQEANLRETTESLHFGLPTAPRRTGVETTITSNRGQSLATSGAEFLSTFGILVEQNWEVTETVTA